MLSVSFSNDLRLGHTLLNTILMKTTFLFFIILATTLTVNAQSPLEGHWNTGKENTVIDIQKVDEGFEGRIFSSDNPKAPQEKLIVKDVIKVGEAYEGKLYALKRGKWFDAVFSPKGEVLEIVVSAGFMKKTVEWTKAD